MTFDIVPFFGFVPVLVFIVAVILISIFTNKVKQVNNDANNNNEQNKNEGPTSKPFATKKMSEEDKKKAKAVGIIFIIVGALGFIAVMVGVILTLFTPGTIVDLFFFAPVAVVFFILGLILINAKAVNERASSAIDKMQGANNNEKEKPVYRCDYCGARLEDSDKRCPGCGARRKVKKD